MRAPFVLVAAVALATAATAQPLTDPFQAEPHPTVGVANPDVTDANIDQTICKPGWTKTIRPPASYTNKLKAEQLPPGADPHLYEEDHVWPLEAGGNPRDPRNLRPQYWTGPSGARAKDHQAENVAHKAICAHTMTLAQAHAFIAQWIITHNPYPALPDGAPGADPEN